MAQRDRKTTGLARQSPHAVPKSGYGFLRAVLDRFSANTEELAAELDAPHKTGGNPGYPAQQMLRAYVTQFLLGERYVNRFLNRLGNDPRLLSLCELDRAPSEVAYSRFKNGKLAPRQDELDRAISVAVFDGCHDWIETLRRYGTVPLEAPLLGQYLAVDATDIPAYARPRGKHCGPDRANCTEKHGRHCNTPTPEQCNLPSHRPCADPDATWGWRTRKGKSPLPETGKKARGKKAGSKKKADDDRGEQYFGYKAHTISDAFYGLPLFTCVRPANEPGGSNLKEDLESAFELNPRLRDRVIYLIADKDYHGIENFKYLADELGVIPVIAIIEPPEDDRERRLYDGIYDTKGRPVCIGGESMEFTGTDSDGAHHFRCPPEGCRLKDKVGWSRHCHDEHSEKPKGKLLRVMGVVHRSSAEWKRIAKMRPIIERLFSSGKQTRLLDKHQSLGLERVSLHVRMSMLSHLLTSWGRLAAGDYGRMRRMTIKLPRATRAAGLGGTQECAQCRLCSHHDPEGSAE